MAHWSFSGKERVQLAGFQKAALTQGRMAADLGKSPSRSSGRFADARLSCSSVYRSLDTRRVLLLGDKADVPQKCFSLPRTIKTGSNKLISLSIEPEAAPYCDHTESEHFSRVNVADSLRTPIRKRRPHYKSPETYEPPQRN